MKRLSVPARIIVIAYLAIAFFMLVSPPTTPRSWDPSLGRETDYGALFVNVLALSVAAALALAVSSLLSSKRKGKEKQEQHGTGTNNV